MCKAAHQLVEPAQNSTLRLVVPGPGTPGGDVIDKLSDDPLEAWCDANFAVLSFREEAPDAQTQRSARSTGAGACLSSSDGHGSCYSDSRINGPNSLPCSPPANMDATGDADVVVSDSENKERAVKNPAIMQGRGLQGLSNLGNTCFMNSSLQCLSNSAALTRFFLSEEWRRDLNRDNPLGMEGNLADEFSNILHDLWAEPRSYAVCPRDFKRVIGRFAPQFTGYSQHDSQELLAFLLDGLHEDLNRIQSKPPTEIPTGDGSNDGEVAELAWRRHRMRNDSRIQDLFAGQYRSELICPSCNNISVTFDPYTSVSVQLPQASHLELALVVHLLERREEHRRPLKVCVNLPRQDSKIVDLKRAVGALLNVRAESLAVAEVQEGKIRSIHSNADKLWDWRRCIIEDGAAHVYEVEGTLKEVPRMSIHTLTSSVMGPAGPSEAAGPRSLSLPFPPATSLLRCHPPFHTNTYTN